MEDAVAVGLAVSWRWVAAAVEEDDTARRSERGVDEGVGRGEPCRGCGLPTMLTRADG